MKWCFITLLLALACGGQAMAGAQLELLTNREPQCLFAGAAKNIALTFSNPGDGNFAAAVRVRLSQLSSATAVQLADRVWKNLEVLPRQTILESAQLDFPAVNAETKFLAQWFTDTNELIGNTEVLVYPTNLLAELTPMFAADELGVLDHNGALKPSLKQNGVEFLDLEETSLEDFSGKLAIIGPFESRAQIRDGLPQAIRRIAIKGAAVVWLQPPAAPRDEITPSFYVVPEGRGAVVVVQPQLVADFSESPRSQLNLIYLCKLALHPGPVSLPNFSPQP